MSESSLKRHLQFYRSQHTTLGCKVTHLVGVPMIFLSFPMLFYDWKRAIVLFSGGWILQFVGHFVFEKNRPVLMTKGRHTYTILSALVFVGSEWLDTARFVRIRLSDSNNGAGDHN
ncbi:MAG: DUF962 domain-containing protein [Candidatus Obscuribacterales bacterium]|nr:DUF962 domain-containing protein [Candidatus Obscuribacterales bacterium]